VWCLDPVITAHPAEHATTFTTMMLQKRTHTHTHTPTHPGAIRGLIFETS